MKPGILRDVLLWTVIGLFTISVAWRFLPIDVRHDLLGPPIPSGDYRERLRDMAIDSRGWTGACPDWSAVPGGSADAIATVQAAAHLGEPDAIWCIMTLYEGDVDELEAYAAESRYYWLSYARLLGEDSASVRDRLHELEPYLSADARAEEERAARRMKRDADWVAEQGWLDD